MKPDIHPDYHKVVFVDTATGDKRVGRSTMTSNDTENVDGDDLPVIKLEISAASHPFWTGTMRELDADGKIDRFRRRYATKKK
jgi:large subunit ribosomal protein L31